MIDKMKIMTVFLIFSIVFLFFEELASEEIKEKKITKSRKDCLEQLKDKATREPIFSEVRNLFKDSLNKWKKMNLKFTDNYNNELWYVDKILCFNQDYNICKLFVLQLDTTHDGKLHDIKSATGVLKKNQWYFYYTDQPVFYIEKDKLKKKYPNERKIINGYNFGRIKAYLDYIISKHFFIENECVINDQMVRYGYSESSIIKHQQFLENQLE